MKVIPRYLKDDDHEIKLEPNCIAIIMAMLSVYCFLSFFTTEIFSPLAGHSYNNTGLTIVKPAGHVLAGAKIIIII